MMMGLETETRLCNDGSQSQSVWVLSGVMYSNYRYDRHYFDQQFGKSSFSFNSLHQKNKEKEEEPVEIIDDLVN